MSDAAGESVTRAAKTTYSALRERIVTREATVCVMGLGYVGLPLAVAFAEAGFKVIGIDIDPGKVDAINRGQSYVADVGPQTVARLVNGADNPNDGARPAGSLSATGDYNALSQADAVIVCVPTPLSKTKDPDLTYIVAAADAIAARLRRGMLVVLESTTYPGTTEELVLPRLQDAQGRSFEAGRDFFLAFSPERIDPGRTDWTIGNTPKVIGGLTPKCLELAVRLYGSAMQTVVPVSSPRVAEMVKLLENTFRATNIALANEFAIMCDRLGVNVWQVIEAASTKPFGFMPFYPGPGLGGHCLPIDPEYLAWKMKTLDYDARFIRLAEEINFGMPRYVVGKVADALNEDGKPLKGSRVLVLGVAYKADVSDIRESPALDLVHMLSKKGALVSYHDPHVRRLTADGLWMESVGLTEETLRQADCVLIATAHSSYDWQWVVEHSRLVVDTRNATGKVRRSTTRARIVTL